MANIIICYLLFLILLVSTVAAYALSHVMVVRDQGNNDLLLIHRILKVCAKHAPHLWIIASCIALLTAWHTPV